jgi:hypothetical protein
LGVHGAGARAQIWRSWPEVKPLADDVLQEFEMMPPPYTWMFSFGDTVSAAAAQLVLRAMIG